jgi:cytoskeleton protein RodZ
VNDLTNNPDNGEDFAADAARPSLGQTLRALREAQGLAVEDVAQSTKFSPRQIEALEQDDLSGLPPVHAFVRGFVRSYAKLLRTDAEPLLSLLEADTPSAAEEFLKPQDIGARMPTPGASRNWLPLLGAAFIAAALAALATHYFYRAPEPAASAPVAEAAPVAAPASEAPVSAPMSPTQVAAAPPAAVTEAAAPNAVATVPAAPAAPAVPAAPPAAVAAGHRLIFTFDDKSWVEVRDASQRVVFAQMNPPGSRQVVSGQPPFQVVVGNAVRVRLQYDERTVDLAPYIRAEVARLTVE